MGYTILERKIWNFKIKERKSQGMKIFGIEKDSLRKIEFLQSSIFQNLVMKCIPFYCFFFHLL